jgi:cytochrome P450
MTSTIGSAADQAEVPSFPAARAAGCPFDPPPALQALREQTRLARVRLWDGSTPWLVTRHADQRALLADPRISADITRPGYPSPVPVMGGSISFILMDDPEHARLRRMVTAPFTIKRMAAMRRPCRRSWTT